MEYSRVEIRPGVWLTHLREEKFKTACFSVNLLSQLSRQTVSMNALVPYVLHRGTKLWPDMQALSEREEELFGTVVEPIVRRIGEIHCSGFYAGFPEDEYLPGDESVLSDAIGLSLSLLLDPITRGGLLLPDYVESEQEKLLDMIAARVNNKRSYAVLRCMEEMCAFEDYAAGRLGDEAGARAINYKKLSRHYRMLLQTCPIELFYCGHADVKKVRAILQDQLATLPRGEIDFDIGTEIRMNAVEDQPRLTVEKGSEPWQPEAGRTIWEGMAPSLKAWCSLLPTRVLPARSLGVPSLSRPRGAVPAPRKELCASEMPQQNPWVAHSLAATPGQLSKARKKAQRHPHFSELLFGGRRGLLDWGRPRGQSCWRQGDRH